MRRFTKMSLAIVTPAFLVACGNSGPSKGDIQKLMNQEITQMNNSVAQVAGTPGMQAFGDLSVTVDSASCTSGQNGIYSCLVTETASGNTQAATINVTKSNGNWVLVNQGS
jgi:hypothetical protein